MPSLLDPLDPDPGPRTPDPSWTHNLTILARCKSAKEREFYLRQKVGEVVSQVGWLLAMNNRIANAPNHARAAPSTRDSPRLIYLVA